MEENEAPESDDPRSEPAFWPCVLAHPPGHPYQPRWKRTALRTDDGMILVPAALAGNETVVYWTVFWTGNVPQVMYEGHLFVALDWLKREDPETKAVCRRIAARLRAITETEEHTS